MNNHPNTYDTVEDHFASNGTLRYYFISQGKKDIIKLIQYQYIKHFNDSPIFNLGFADLDLQTGILSDEEPSGNEDQYKVFRTVLNTIPRLFEAHKNSTLMVQGSDSRPEYIEKCKANCTRQCKNGECKKAHRRIRIYRNFVDQNWDLLHDYNFKGSIGIEDQSLVESYKKGTPYNVVFVSKNN